MTGTQVEAEQRIARLLDAMQQLVAPGSRRRRELCERLVSTTGLSASGVSWAIDHCLELRPEPEEVRSLVASVKSTRRAHVILPANVFIAAHRAIALALAAAPKVFVKPSRREPALVDALLELAPELFERVSTLDVVAGDQVWAYGSDTTLAMLRRDLPAGAILHAHGSGFGICVVDLAPLATDGEPDALGRAALAIAEDTACFDQRGCLSPRLILALGGAGRAREFAERLAEAMIEVERRLPRGLLEPTELADARWYRECSACFDGFFAAGQGALRLWRAPPASWEQTTVPIEIPPVGRHLEVIALSRLEPALVALQRWVTAAGCSDTALARRVREALPHARVGPLGAMQRPSFDGPVDRRSALAGEIIGASIP